MFPGACRRGAVRPSGTLSHDFQGGERAVGWGRAVLEHSYLATKLLPGREEVQTLQGKGVKGSLTLRLSPGDLNSLFVPSPNYSLASQSHLYYSVTPRKAMILYVTVGEG